MENIVLPGFPLSKANVVGGAPSRATVILKGTKSFPRGTATWFDDRSWNFLRAQFRSSNLAWTARKALACAFDDDFLRDQTVGSHPLGAEWIMRYGRYGIFRLGAALARFGVSHATRTRLQHPRQYRACAAELDFGLFLATTGAVVTHEPLTPARGPDFALESPLGTCGFEVKSPAASESLAARSRAALHFACELQRLAPHVSGTRGWLVEPRVATDVWPSLLDDRALSDALSATHTEIGRWAQSPREGEFRVCDGVSVSVRRGAAEGVQIWGPTFAGDGDKEASRLLNVHAQRAATQLAALRAPGFLVFSHEESGLILDYAHRVIQGIRADANCSSHVTGLIVYDLRVIRSRLVPIVHIYVRREAQSALQVVESWRRAGCVYVHVL